MTQLNYFCLLILFIINFTSTAQDYKFGKVSKEELMEISSPIDSIANAVVLYKNVEINYEYSGSKGFEVVMNIHKRIKLYNKRGFDYANNEIFLYYKGNNREQLKNLKGISYSLVDDEIVEAKLKKESVFRNKYSETHNQVKFTMPDLKEGSVVEYKYSIRSPFIGNIDKIALQYDIPIKKLNFNIQIPEYFHFKTRLTGHLPVNLKQSEKNDMIVITSTTRSTAVGFSPTISSNSRDEIKYKSNVFSLDKENIPAFIIEPFSGNIQNYISGVLFELEYTKYPNSIKKTFASTWESVINKVYENSRFGGELKKNKYFKEDIEKLLIGKSDPLEKMNAIYEYLKTEMVWNNVSSVLPIKSLKKSYEEKVGNSSEINLLLIAMLDYVKIKVNPVLVTTNKKPLSLFPTLEGYNYVIARVKINQDIFYLDATDKYALPNVLPIRVVQGAGRLINEYGNSELIFFRPSEISKQSSRAMYEIDEKGLIKGKQRTTYTNNKAHDFRRKRASLSKESNIDFLNASYQINNVSNYNLKNTLDLKKPVQEVFSFETNNETEIIDNEMFFSPMLYLRSKENIFKEEERVYPVDYAYKFEKDFFISIKIPDGYTVATLPKDAAIALPNNLGKFTYKSTFSNSILQVVVKTNLNKSIISPEDYPYLKQFYSKIVEKENELIVLKKI